MICKPQSVPRFFCAPSGPSWIRMLRPLRASECDWCDWGIEPFRLAWMFMRAIRARCFRLQLVCVKTWTVLTFTNELLHQPGQIFCCLTYSYLFSSLLPTFMFWNRACAHAHAHAHLLAWESFFSAQRVLIKLLLLNGPTLGLVHPLSLIHLTPNI